MPSTLYIMWHNYADVKFEVPTSNSLGGDAFTKRTLYDLDLRSQGHTKVAQFPLHHVTYAHA